MNSLALIQTQNDFVSEPDDVELLARPKVRSVKISRFERRLASAGKADDPSLMSMM
jgi:hypothetical protein